MSNIVSTIYTENSVSAELVKEVREAVSTTGLVNVSFNVTGRTNHSILSRQLAKELSEFEFEIGDNYECIVKIHGWVPNVSSFDSIAELKEKAKSYQVKGYSQMNKGGLVEAVNNKINQINNPKLSSL